MRQPSINEAMTDGAYDSVKLTNAILNKQPDASIVIPPPSDAVISPEGDTQRDEHICLLEEVGHIAWKKENDYGLRSQVELCMLRYKKIIGPSMKARKIPQQKTEGGIGVRVLNRMTSLGMPESVKVS
ncbi:MAG: hypothetical protein CK423_06130 [Legionella sp.]|nr:MAG: hypothetical protein CK423_06130 [Legionella sp.]